MVAELESFNINVDVYDHWADSAEVKNEYNITLITEITSGFYDAVVLAVDHSDYKHWGEQKIRNFCKKNHVLYDLKYVLPLEASDIRL